MNLFHSVFAAALLASHQGYANSIDPTSDLPVANPYLAFLPSTVSPDYQKWQGDINQHANRSADGRGGAFFNNFAPAAMTVQANGMNQSFATAQTLTGVGSAENQDDRLDVIKGSPFTQSESNTILSIEDNGTIGTAQSVNVAVGSPILITGEIGDGPHGSGGGNTGDFDFYDLGELDAGEIIILDVNAQTLIPMSGLDSAITLLDSGLNVVADNDFFENSLDAYLEHTLETTGNYYLVIGSYVDFNQDALPSDFNNAASGPGVNTEGAYEMIVHLLNPPAPPTTINVAEDNGAVSVATAVDLSTATQFVAQSYLGDGPHGSVGSASGDFDIFRLDNVALGAKLEIDVDARSLTPMSALDGFLTLLDENFTVVASNDDYFGFDPYLEYVTQSSGPHYVVLGAFRADMPSDLQDSGSGTGAMSEGDYELHITTTIDAKDYYEIDLIAGDVLRVSVSDDADIIEIMNDAQVVMMGAPFNITGITPTTDANPALPGNAGISFVAPSTGTYKVRVSSKDEVIDNYLLCVQVVRPSLDTGEQVRRQKLFIDFDGAVIDRGIFFFMPSGTVILSPLVDFLPAWGLLASDENAVIDAILNVVEEQLINHVHSHGNNGLMDLEILNSRDHPDTFGDADVSRIIVGGTQMELGIQTIGLSQSIDPGNFDTEETAVVLLDILSSETRTDEHALNNYQLAAGTTMIDLIGVAVGTIVSHEAGHFFSSFHTENSNNTVNIMDQGGRLLELIGGTNVNGQFMFDKTAALTHFENDEFALFEGLVGMEDTLNATAYGLSTSLVPEIDNDGDQIPNTVDTDDDNDGLTDAEELGLGTDPLNPDSDNDFVNDMDDMYPLDPTRSELQSSEGGSTYSPSTGGGAGGSMSALGILCLGLIAFMRRRTLVQ